MAEHGPDVWEPVVASQIGGHLNVTRPAWAAMAAQGGGRILNVSSGAGSVGCARDGRRTPRRRWASSGSPGRSRSRARRSGSRVNVIAPSAKTRPGGFGPIPASPRLHEWMSVDQVAALARVARARRLHRRPASASRSARGYIGRVMVAVNDGFHGRPLSARVGARRLGRRSWPTGRGRRCPPGRATSRACSRASTPAAGERRRERRGAAARHLVQGPEAPRLRDLLERGLRLEHRQLDADDRGAVRRVPDDALDDVARRRRVHELHPRHDLGPFGGSYADRHSRKRILVVTQTLHDDLGVRVVGRLRRAAPRRPGSSSASRSSPASWAA